MMEMIHKTPLKVAAAEEALAALCDDMAEQLLQVANMLYEGDYHDEANPTNGTGWSQLQSQFSQYEALLAKSE